MNKSELIRILSEIPGDPEVYIASDEEGNSIHRFEVLTTMVTDNSGAYDLAEESVYNDIDDAWSDWYHDFHRSDWQTVIVLWP